MTIEEFMKKLEGVREDHPGQYSAKCPAHDDKTASLSVGKGRDNRIVVHCHAGCDHRDILAAMGLSEADLFDDSRKPVREAKQSRRKIVARYDYIDENGALLNQKTRWVEDGKKTFTWSHREGGRWIKGRKGEPTLYNLPVVKGAGCVYVVEGEKDVETLKALHIPAVCGADGAGPGKWLPQYTEALRGAHVVVIPDNDDTGRAFAVETANSLHGVASSVQVADLLTVWPELPEHGDSTDIFEKFGKEGVISILSAAAKAPLWEPTQPPETVPEFFDGKRFLHNVMGDYLIKAHGVCKINGAVHIYDNGIYKPGEEILHGFMIQLVPELTDARRKEVYKYIKVNPNTPEKQLSPPYLIPFATRIYNVQNDCFLDYTPDHVFLNRFPYDYKPDAPLCGTVTGTISQIAGNDPEVVNLLYEAMGNCFYLLNSFRGAVMLYGRSGNNGKSTLLNMITQLLGRENASYLSLQDTAERFRLVEVYGKAANIGDDIPSAYLPESSIFKKLVTGEMVTAEKKGQDPFSFKPYAKMFFAMNGLPPVSDKSKAFFSRILLIPLNQDFSKSGKKDVRLKDRKWTQREMECLTRLAVDGLKRLLTQGDFTRPECVQRAVDEYEAENNPIREFLGEIGDITGMSTQEVYFKYQSWCYDSGHKNLLTRTKFTKEVKAETGMIIKDRRNPAADGRVVKCFYNFSDCSGFVAQQPDSSATFETL